MSATRPPLASTDDRPDRYRVHRLTDPHEVAHRVADLLRADPIGGNVLATTLSAVLRGRSWPAGSFWVVIEDGAGHAVGAAVCTASLPPFLTPMPVPQAHLIARWLHRAGHEVDGVRGEAGAGRAFADRWTALTGRTAHLVRSEGVHVLDRLLPPVGVPGRARVAGEADTDVAARWSAAFEREAHGPSGVSDHAVAVSTERFLGRVADGHVTLWTDPADRPVSMAAGQLPAEVPGPAVARIGPVYTPPEHRRRGYAAAATAAATRRVEQAGAERVMLYTDLANATSNGVYARLGYRRVGEAASWEFSAG